MRAASGLTLALAVLACAPKAEAGCAGNAASHEQAAWSVYGFDSLVEFLSIPASPSRPGQQPMPCTGAFCSKNQEAPIPVSTGVVRAVEAIVPHLLLSPDPRTRGQALPQAERIDRALVDRPTLLRPPR